MTPEFWHDRWRENRIGFHEVQPNAFLISHFQRLGLQAGKSVFVPLCGKSVDVAWLAAQGLHVKGIELHEPAVQALFDAINIAPEISDLGAIRCYSAGALQIFAGDVFDLTPAQLGQVDAVFDRAALVALPPEMRADYAKQLQRLTNAAPQLLVTFDYDQSTMSGPPFAVPHSELHQLYGETNTLTRLERVAFSGRMAQRGTGFEEVWHVTPR